MPPLLAVIIATVVGWWALGRLATPDRRCPWRLLLLIGAGFSLPAIAIDLAVPFPDDLNVPLPLALAFYPTAGFVAEVVFHLVPLAIVALLLNRKKLPAWAFLPAVVSEPLFQAGISGGLTLQGGLVAVHVAAFAAVQLWLFTRYGFLAMYGLRVVYYGFWHLLWGWFRLQLFP